MPLGVSRRVLNTSTAVIDDLIEEYGEKPGLINLAPGAPAVTPCAATLKAASDAAADAFVSAYGDVLGFEPLCKRWLDQIVSSWEAQALAYPQYASEFSDLSPDKVDKVELMVTAGANQAFVSVVLALCDAGDEVVLLKPYYFSHYNALTACSVVPVAVECDEDTLLPSIRSIREAIGPRTKAVVLVSPGNPSGVIAPPSFVDELVALCRESSLWLVSDEAYKEITFDGLSAFSPNALAGVIRLYTLSKVYGMAGWRVGALVYPSELSIHMRKIQDTIPTHASLLSQVTAFTALQEEAPLIASRVQIFSATRDVFARSLSEVYKQLDINFVTGNSAFYLFLPIETSKREAHDVVPFLVKTSNILTVPGDAFGMPGYVRVSYGSVSIADASRAAAALQKGLCAWFNVGEISK